MTTLVLCQVSPALDETSRTIFALSCSCSRDSFRTQSTELSLFCWCLSAKTVPHQVLSTRLSEIQTYLHGSAINSTGLVSFVSFNTMLPYELVVRPGVCIDNQSSVLSRSSRGAIEICLRIDRWTINRYWNIDDTCSLSPIETEHITQTLTGIFVGASAFMTDSNIGIATMMSTISFHFDNSLYVVFT